MLVGEIMTSPAVTVRHDATPQVAVALLARRRLTMLDIQDDANRLLKDLGPHWEATVSNGVATISGPGPDREVDAAASLTATVMGVRAIRLAETHRREAAPGGTPPPAPDEWSMHTRTSPSSSGTGVDQL